jgi:hypothetical protein
MVPRFYTPEEATKTLPLVRHIVAEIQDVSQGQRTSPLGKTITLEKHLQELIQELERFGAYLKEADSGFVDFYGIRGDEIVWLSWKPGEEEIRYWRKLTEDVEKRKPIVEWPDNQLNSSTSSAE